MNKGVESLFASFSSEKEGASLSSLDVLLRGLGFALGHGARVTVKVEMGDREAALLERAVRALEGFHQGRPLAGPAPATQEAGHVGEPGGAILVAAAPGVGAADDRRDDTQRPASGEAGELPSHPGGSAAEQGPGASAEDHPSPPAPPVVRNAESLAKARVARWSGETWLTAERAVAMQAGWEAGEDVHALGARLAEMPGPEMPGIRAIAQKAWIRGWKRPAGYKPLLGRPQPAEARTPPAWQTPERLAELRRLVVEQAASWPRVTEVLSAMEGPPVPQYRQSVRRWAMDNGIEPPARPATTWRNPLRAEVLRRDWPAGVNVHAIKAAMAELPGLALPHGIVCLGTWAGDLGLRRPEGHVGVVNRVTPREIAAGTAAAPKAAAPAGPGEAVAVSQAPPPPQPPRPVAVLPAPSPAPPQRAPVPKLPMPSGGRHYCSFREIKAWAAHFDIAYNGANIEAVNKRRKLMGLLPVVQDEDRTVADTRAA